MKVQDLIAALELPASCRVDQRIPKKLLVENGAPTAADKRNITEGIEEIQWVASLKPSSIGVSEYRDESREYLEIAVLHIALRQDAKIARIAELTHRAVPYPILLLLTEQGQLTLSMAHIRWAQNEAGKVVLDGESVAVTLNEPTHAPDVFSAFLHALSITRQPRENLKVLYQGWLDTLAAFQAAQITGAFTRSQTDEQAVARRANLLACRELEQKIATLRTAAIKEKQLARQVALNLEIKQLQAKQQQAVSKL
jgi:nitroreductase